MEWFTPWLAVLTVVFVVLSILIGLVRHHSPKVISLETGGFVLFMLGLFWAASVSDAAALAAGAASLGSLLFTLGAERSRTRTSRA